MGPDAGNIISTGDILKQGYLGNYGPYSIILTTGKGWHLKVSSLMADDRISPFLP